MNKHIMIGSTECFGIELDVTSVAPAGVWADVILWIGGKSLGRKDDAFALYPLLGTMDGLLVSASDDALTSEMLCLPANAAWELFETVGREEYSVNTSYLFDRYDVCCASNDLEARFLWKDRYVDPDVLHDVRVHRSEIVRSVKELHSVYGGLSGSR